MTFSKVVVLQLIHWTLLAASETEHAYVKNDWTHELVRLFKLHSPAKRNHSPGGNILFTIVSEGLWKSKRRKASLGTRTRRSPPNELFQHEVLQAKSVSLLKKSESSHNKSLESAWCNYLVKVDLNVWWILYTLKKLEWILLCKPVFDDELSTIFH